MIKNYEELVDAFIAACMMRKDVDYADKVSVRKYNKGMDICRQMVAKLASDYPEQTESFSVLLKSEDDVIAHMCAFCILDLLVLPGQIEREALSVVKKYFETEEPFISYEEWIEEWKKQKPQAQ